MLDIISRGKIVCNFRKNSLFLSLIFTRKEGRQGKTNGIHEWNSLLSKFYELSVNYPKFWIISLLDREIRDLVRGPQKLHNKFRDGTCLTKVKLCIRLGEKFWQSYFGIVMTSSKSHKTAKNQKNRDFIDFSQLWASLSQVWVKVSCFPIILSIEKAAKQVSSCLLKKMTAKKSLNIAKFLFWLSSATE